MQLKAVVRCHLTPKSVNNKFRRECREKGPLLHCWWKCKLVQPVWWFLKKLKIELTLWSTSTTPGHVSGENSNCKRCMHLTFLVVVVLSWAMTLRPHGLQHTRRPSPSLSPGGCSTHVPWVGDAIQPSYPRSSPALPDFSLSQHQGLFQWVGFSHQVAKVLELHHQSFQWIFRVDFL